MAAIGAHGAAGFHYQTIPVRAHAAATATEEAALLWFPDSAIDITRAWHVPDDAITGADTNSTSLNLIDGGSAGSGTTEIANIDYVTGTDATANNEKAFVTAAGTTFTKYALAAGSSLMLQYVKAGTGLAIPTGNIVIEFQPR
jgi:hypothetical protein